MGASGHRGPANATVLANVLVHVFVLVRVFVGACVHVVVNVFATVTVTEGRSYKGRPAQRSRL